MQEIAPVVRKFVANNFLYREGVDALADDASFLETGLIDSTGVLELVCFIEKSFSIRVKDDEVIPDNLDSVQQITAYVQRKLAAEQATPTAPASKEAAYAR